ncbi:MAG TPA: GAF domain-containing protein [Kofleriaceae bacterium]|nr:GAF domain-containing protein [Kofleriaceae bacterium]
MVAVPLHVPLAVHRSTAPGESLLSAIEPRELDAPLEDALAELCRKMQPLLAADVVTIYQMEPGDEAPSLVVRGNVGLPPEVIGHLALSVGDGLVGWVAECMRAISTGAATDDPRWKPMRGIGEEKFPVVLAHPILRRGRCAGVLVFQRDAAPFTDGDVRLAGVLAESAGLVIEAAGRGRRATTQDGTETVCLLGRSVQAGFGIGRVDLIPTVEAVARGDGAPLEPARVREALARVERDLARLRASVPASPLLAAALVRAETILSDARFRERAEAGQLAALARDYARAPIRVAARTDVTDRLMTERAEDVAELCALLHVIASGNRMLQSGRVWVGRRLGAFFALAAARYAAAVVLDGDGDATADAAAIARAAGLPLLVHVRGLFAWSKPDDLLVVDADRGLVRINPSSSAVVAAREASRRRR